MSRKVILTDAVASFMYKGKRYKPGDTIELPDNYPVKLYPFLKTIVPTKTVVPTKSIVPKATSTPQPAKAKQPTRR